MPYWSHLFHLSATGSPKDSWKDDRCLVHITFFWSRRLQGWDDKNIRWIMKIVVFLWCTFGLLLSQIHLSIAAPSMMPKLCLFLPSFNICLAWEKELVRINVIYRMMVSFLGDTHTLSQHHLRDRDRKIEVNEFLRLKAPLFQLFCNLKWLRWNSQPKNGTLIFLDKITGLQDRYQWHL